MKKALTLTVCLMAFCILTWLMMSLMNLTHSEPFIYDIKKLLKALSDKEAAAQSEVDAFMENCAKRWQTREGTYQLKRRRLPDVRDLPEYPGADIDMEDI